MDIFDININQITHQYLEFIKAMKKLDLEMAGDFVAMAATLIHIKSKMLLPQYDPETGEPLQEDPRKELVDKLIEYQKFQQASKDLYKRPLLGRDVFARGNPTEINSAEEGELILEEKPLFSMIKAYRHAIKNMKKTIHRVIGDLQSISGRILEMKDHLLVGVRVSFQTLLATGQHAERSQVLVTFLSLLELAKMGLVSLFQADPTTEIYVEAKKTIDKDVISQTESYDNANAAGKADEIFAMAAQELKEEKISVSLEEGTMSEDEEYAQQELQLDPSASAEGLLEEAASDEDILAAERELNFIESAPLTIEEIIEEPLAVKAENETSEQTSDEVLDQALIEVQENVESAANTYEQFFGSAAEQITEQKIEEEKTEHSYGEVESEKENEV